MKRIIISILLTILSLQVFSQATSGTRLSAPIVPNDSTDVYPSHDAFFGRDGYRSVLNITQRNNIPVGLRKEGMLVWVKADSIVYQLLGGVSNTNWIYYSSSKATVTNTNISAWNAITPFPGFGTSHSTSAYGDHLHSVYQTITDNSLTTTSNTMPGAINELNDALSSVKDAAAYKSIISQNKNANFTIPVPADCRLNSIDVLKISGTPSIRIGTTSGGNELLSDTVISSDAKFNLTKYFAFSGTLHVTISGGEVNTNVVYLNKVFKVLQLSEQYSYVLNAMKAASSEPTEADKLIQNRLVERLAPYDSICDLLQVFSTHSAATALINWKNPGTHDAIKVNSPNFTAYTGWKSSGSGNYLRLNFNPYTDAVKASSNNVTIFAGVYDPTNTSTATGYEFGAMIGGSTRINLQTLPSSTAFRAYFTANATGSPINIINSKGSRHMAIRISGTEFSAFQNKCKIRPGTTTNLGFPNLELYGLCENLGGAPTGYSNKNLLYFAVYKGSLTDDQVLDIQSSFEQYHDNYSTGSIGIERNIAWDGHSFLTYPYSVNYFVADQISLAKMYNLAGYGNGIQGLIDRGYLLDESYTQDKRDMMFVWIGINDIVGAGDGLRVYNLVKSYAQTRAASGWKHQVYYTCTPTTVKNVQSEIDIYNNNLINNLQNDVSGSTIHIINTYDIPESLTPSNTTYYSDGLHPTEALFKLFTTPTINYINQVYTN